MRITRRVFLKSSAASIAASAVAIGAAAGLTASRGTFAQGAPRVLRLAHGNPESDTVHKAALRLAELVNQRTGGAVQIKVFPGGQLGSDIAMVSAVRGGTIEMGWTGNPYFAGIAPKLNVLDVPFLFRDRAHVAKVIDGTIGDALRAELVPANLVTLSTWEIGWRNISNRRRPIRTPEDVKGLKIRTTPNPTHIRAFQALGATPVPMAFTELYTALEIGAIDGQENPASLILHARFYEVQKYLSLTRHAFTTAPLVINKAKFAALPDDLQKVLVASAKEAGLLQRQMNVEQDTLAVAELRKHGMEVIEQVDRDAFRKIVFEDARKDFVAKNGPELIDRILAA